MEKTQAIFLCDRPETVWRVYDAATLQKLREQLVLPETVYRKADLPGSEAALAQVEYVFSTWGMPELTDEEIAQYFPSLKAVFYGAGTVQAFARPFLQRGIRVFSAWGANAVPVAEYTVAQIILAGKGFFQGIRIQEEGTGDPLAARKAARAYNDTFPCNYNVKVGILGVGMIGSLVCRLLQAYEMDVLVFDPFASDEKLAELGATRADLDTVFAECQTVSCHIANLPATVGMLKYEHFSRMKPNGTFINTGRGAQVVEADLIRALREEPNRTALLDVTYPEPPEPDSPFWTMPNVLLTPHIAGSMNNEVARMGAYMEAEFRDVLAGKPCRYEITEKMLETMA
ncbi:hydroxyacid dehydrogenase [Ruminococcaceae bacterium OttesenSCG-928-L11]|nr:hydroxyacid dehydrogenase [Ruminococcaceae bacterium OttesenSCG-928-L11]